MRAWSGSFWVVLGLLGCGPKPEAKGPAPKPIAAAPAAVEEPPDLSPVKRPSELVLVGRIARPRAFIETLTKWSSLPMRIEDLIPADARPLSKAVLWEAPLEVLVALDAFGEGKLPPPLFVGSVGLKSLDEALSAADAMQLPTRKLAPGVYRVGDFPDTSCAIAVSLGSSPARLICGHGAKDVEALLPYATRGLPSEPQSGADFELTLDAKPVQDHYGHDVAALRLLAGVGINQIALDSPRFDRALSDAVYGVVDETINFFNDLEQVKVEARVDSARNVLTASAELRLKGDSSWAAGTIAAMKPAPVPATLPRIPPEATAAAYNPPYPAERYAAMTRILGELAEGFLEHEKVPEATRKRVRHFTDAWFQQMPEGFMFAVGPSQNDSAPQHASTVVMRLSEPSPRLVGLYTDMFGLAGDPGLKRWLKQKASFKISDKMWPKVSKKPFKLAGFKTPATLFELTIDGKAWDGVDDTFARSFKEMLLATGTAELRRIDVIVQPDGDATYVLTGDDPKEMTRVMAEHKKSEPGAPLAKPAKSDKITVAGFVTLAYFAHAFERNPKTRDLGRALAAAPSRGKTPITFSGSTGIGTARVDIEVPAAVFGDTSAAVVAAAPSLRLHKP
jgi:hypothetical protein